MNSPDRKARQVDHRLRFAYAVELARGASHIASTMSNESLTLAVDEVYRAFIADRGTDDLESFWMLLADALDERGAKKGAAAVRSFPVAAQPDAPKPDSPKPRK